MSDVPLIGFAPDLPSTTPGVMTSCTNIVPTEQGFSGAPEPVAFAPALASSCRGGGVIYKIDGTRRLFAGTQTKLYELVASAWTDVSRGASYTGTATNRWSLAQFGNVTIAANDEAVLQSSTAGAFADIATAPIAKVVISVGDFVIAFNTSDGTYGDQGDRWWCCGIFDHTTWTPSVSTQANTGRLVGGGGDIVAALPMGKQAVAYKSRAMFMGTYVGGAAVWQFDQVPGEQGAVGQEALCDANGVHVFVGEDNIWSFDGVRPVPIANESVRQWFYENALPQYKYKTIVQYERQNNRVWIFFAGLLSGGALDSALVLHMTRKRWGRADVTIEAAMQLVQAASLATIDGLSGAYTTMDGLPEIPFDSSYWFESGKFLTVFNSSHQPCAHVGNTLASAFTTGDIGDQWRGSSLLQARLAFATAPSAASVTGECFDNIGGAARTGGSGTFSRGKFDIKQSGRWHRLSFSFTGPVVAKSIDLDLRPGGYK